MANAPQLFRDDEEEARSGSPSDDELRHITGSGHGEGSGSAAEDIAKREKLFNPSGDDGDSAKSASPSSLRSAEGGAAGTAAAGSESGGFYRSESPSRRTKLKGKLKGLASKKWLMLGVGGCGAGLGLVLIMLLLFASSLKIPDLAQNITTYEFARLTRQFDQSAQRSTDEALVLEASDTGASNSYWSTLNAKYANAKTSVAETWSLLDDYRPSQVIQNLGVNNDMQLNVQDGHFVNGTLDDVPFSINPVQGIPKYVPGLNQVISFKNDVSFSQEFAPALEDALRVNEVGPIMRGIVANKIRSQLGIGLIAWHVGKYQGENADQARVTEEQEKVSDIDGESPAIVEGADDTLNTAESDAATAETQALSTTAGTEAIINNDGIIPGVKTAIGNALAQSGLQDVLSIVNPVAKIATPLCIIYDGSLDSPSAGQSIDQQDKQQETAFYYAESGADQQKAGSNYSVDPSGDGLATAVNAANDDFGDTTESNPEIQASGGTVDTSSSISPEASSDGQFTLLNALDLPGPLASFFNSTANGACPIITDPATQIALGVGTIALQLIPGADVAVDGVETASEAGGDAAAQVITETTSQSLVQRLTAKVIGEKASNFTSKASQMVFDTGKNAAAIAGATVLAKLIVNNRAGQINSGTAQGPDLANEAASGGNIQANELERTQLFGRPMLEDEVCTSNQDDQDFVYNQESHESAFDRYLAPSNADSLLSQTAIAIGGNFNGSLGSSLMHLSSSLLKPFNMFSSLGSMLFGRSYAAANCDSVSSDYGNVQFGWSDDEENMINSSGSYQPLENQAILDTATNGGEAAIAQTYANCFGYTYNPSGDGSFNPSDPNGNLQLAIKAGNPGSIGTLLQTGDITRDSDGNVIGNATVPGGALCSPGNLSYDNNAYGPQMVFRWRLAMQYDNTLEQLTNQQTVQTNQTAN